MWSSKTLIAVFAIVVLFSWACVHNNPSAGPVLAGSTGWSPTEGSAGAALAGSGAGGSAAGEGNVEGARVVFASDSP